MKGIAMSFEVGQWYLVYADLDEGALFVSKCSRTQTIKEAGRDVGVLDALKAAEKKKGARRG